MAANKLILEFVDAGKSGSGPTPAPPPGGGPTPTSPTASPPTPVSGQGPNVAKILTEQRSQFANFLQGLTQAQGGNIGGAINSIGGKGAASAAGTAGAVAAIIEKAKSEVRGLMEQVQGDARAIGQASRQIVDNDALGALNTHVERFNETLDKHAPLVGSAVRTMTGPMQQFAGVIESLVQRGKTQLAEFDGRTAQASAVAELREIRSLMREANENGGATSELIERTSRWQEAIEAEFLIPLKREMLAYSNAAMTFFEKLLTAFFGLKIGDPTGDEFDKFMEDWMNGQMARLNRTEPNGFINANPNEIIRAREDLFNMLPSWKDMFKL